MTPRTLLTNITRRNWFAVAAAWGSDWPQHLGPARNGFYSGTDFHWTGGKLTQAWSRDVGAGFAAPSFLNGVVYLFHRLNNEEVLEAISPATGKTVWKTSYPTAYRDDFGFDEGPRAAPTLYGNRAYLHGADGVLTAVEIPGGKILWQRNILKEFSAPKGFFGAVCAPLVFENTVLLGSGGPNNGGIAAFDATTGKTVWQALSDEAGYSSPVIAPLGGQPRAIFFTRNGLAVLDPRSGKAISQFRWRSRSNASVNAATPLVSGNEVFLTASYGTGAVLLDLSAGQPKVIWSGDDSLSSHYATPVLKDGYLYGYHGRQEMGAALRCVEWKTGKVRWNIDGYGAGSILLAGNNLLLMRESGQVAIAPATPAAYKPAATFQALDATVRAYPAIGNGVLFIRNEKRLAAFR